MSRELVWTFSYNPKLHKNIYDLISIAGEVHKNLINLIISNCNFVFEHWMFIYIYIYYLSLCLVRTNFISFIFSFRGIHTPVYIYRRTIYICMYACVDSSEAEYERNEIRSHQTDSNNSKGPWTRANYIWAIQIETKNKYPNIAFDPLF